MFLQMDKYISLHAVMNQNYTTNASESEGLKSYATHARFSEVLFIFFK